MPDMQERHSWRWQLSVPSRSPLPGLASPAKAIEPLAPIDAIGPTADVPRALSKLSNVCEAKRDGTAIVAHRQAPRKTPVGACGSPPAGLSTIARLPSALLDRPDGPSLRRSLPAPCSGRRTVRGGAVIRPAVEILRYTSLRPSAPGGLKWLGAAALRRKHRRPLPGRPSALSMVGPLPLWSSTRTFLRATRPSSQLLSYLQPRQIVSLRFSATSS